MKKIILPCLLFASLIISGCKKDDNTKKDFTLEMKVNGVLWVAEKNQVGLYSTADKSLEFSGQKGDELLRLSKDSMNGIGTYSMPSGSITLFLGSGSSIKQYYINASKPNTRGSVSLITIIPNPSSLASLANTKYAEADFSGVLYDSFNTDSVVITEGKLRYQ